MGRISQNIKTRIDLIKHLEKSKCFFRIQKGGAYVYLGMGAYSTWLVSVLDGCSILLIAHNNSNQRV